MGVGALISGAGALVLGEYPFSGPVVVGAALVLGLLVAEAVLAVDSRRGPESGILCAALTGAGLAWGAWISEGHVLGRVPIEGWAAVALGAGAAALRASWLRAGAGTPSGPAPPG